MATRLTIDPVTRIEGHLRMDVSVSGGVVQDAWTSCTMWRGMETILRGRDAREAWLVAQRFCGVCTTVHGIASVRAVEDALGLVIPNNAQSIRNLILIAHALHDHIVHFYHLSALDWVDITTIPHADAKAAARLGESMSAWTGNSAAALRAVQQRVTSLVESGELGIFANGYWGHRAMRLSPEQNLLLLAHYFQALDFQRRINQVVAILGAKTPHIQNLAVGGVMNAINRDSLATLNTERMYTIKAIFEEVLPFVREVYVADTCLLAAAYPEWLGIGRGVDNYAAIADLPHDGRASAFDLPGGLLLGGDVRNTVAFDGWTDDRLRRGVTEDVTHAWYAGDRAQHPYEGETVPAHGPYDERGKYSWVKAPRFEGHALQTGPLADVLVGYGLNHQLTREWTEQVLQRIGRMNGQPMQVGMLRSTMGRYVARAIRAAMLGDLALAQWSRLDDAMAGGDSRTFNPPAFPDGEISGVGLHAAPRGMLSHWVVIKAGTIVNYQAVVPTTWNASPRDAKGVRGPYEAALVGTPIADEARPLEVLRTVHSFDPCMACACHLYDASGQPMSSVRVL
jgi:hydrogenase large subunit